ncbi:heme lyase CcmF/NrfE family subunit [Legionella sp. W05-934-2]|jgi:cytochrome c-type biogenesis protein CcmF|uniref:heme lyase CcmF/NrfE family subunit n=1 Tax=Legionella sp. W05-934-2 TaxID=1198649 RepID=UPI003461A064
MYFPEIGLMALILALLSSFVLMVIPTIGIVQQREDVMGRSRNLTRLVFLLVLIAQAILTVCFIQDDFSVLYVASNSSTLLPWFYKLCAVWGGHEGSILLWVLILTFWMVLIAQFSQYLPIQFVSRVLIVLGFLSFGLLSFILFTSNPFIRQLTPIPLEGRDLNPLLQDPGFLFHPPMLYMGYVGFAIAFAFAIAALWMGTVESTWARWTRPWTMGAWCCLTVGITLGSWWAYRELGWGGWWFWDPVENASFMPWLAGTALIHSLIACEKREQFKAWTVLLAIMTFSLSLIGTFLVRSGVLTSVHAFAVDPQRGLYILAFLIIVIGGSLSLFAWRGETLVNPHKPRAYSREGFLLLNNIILVVTLFSILLGTLYPLIVDGLNLGKISVGAPYFNTVFVPLMIPLFVLMGVGIHVRWQSDRFIRIRSTLIKMVIITIITAFGVFWWADYTIYLQPFFGLCLALWIKSSILLSVINRWKENGIRGMTASFWSMNLAHFGVAMVIVGVSISTGYGITRDVSMKPGQQLTIGGYTIQFESENTLQGPNYGGTIAQFHVEKGNYHSVVYPEKRIYHVGKMAMTDAAIDVTPFRDIYIALGEPLDDNSWSVRLYYKPLVRWIWAGGFVILLGGLTALLNPRYYRKCLASELGMGRSV